MGELHRLPGAQISPEYILHRQLEQLADIKAVVIVIQYTDDTYAVARSCMPMSNLCMASVVLQDDAARAIRGGSGEIVK